MAIQRDVVDFSQYTHIMSVSPLFNGCPWGGIAYVGSKQFDNLNDDIMIFAVNGLDATEHEIGHTLGSWHASSFENDCFTGKSADTEDNCSIIEYGDPYDILGDGWLINDTSFNAYHRNVFEYIDDASIKQVRDDSTYLISSLNSNDFTNYKALEIRRPNFTLFPTFYVEYNPYDDMNGRTGFRDGVIIYTQKYIVGSGGGGDTQLIPIDEDNINTNLNYPLLFGDTFIDQVSGLSITARKINDDLVEVETRYPSGWDFPTVSINNTQVTGNTEPYSILDDKISITLDALLQSSDNIDLNVFIDWGDGTEVFEQEDVTISPSGSPFRVRHDFQVDSSSHNREITIRVTDGRDIITEEKVIVTIPAAVANVNLTVTPLEISADDEVAVNAVITTSSILSSIELWSSDGASQIVTPFLTTASNTSADVTYTVNEKRSFVDNGRDTSYTIGIDVIIGGVTIRKTETVRVTTVNHPPVLAPIPTPITVLFNTSIGIELSATDPEGDTLTFFSVSLPSGAIIAGNRFEWKPTVDQVGDHHIQFAVTDGVSNGTQNVLITVASSSPPVFVPSTPTWVNATVGSLTNIILSATDPDGDALTFSSPDLPNGAILNAGTFAWTPDESQIGEHIVTFVVNDGEWTVNHSVTINVEPPIVTEECSIEGNFCVDIGEFTYLDSYSVSGTLLASASTAKILRGEVDWGDGTVGTIPIFFIRKSETRVTPQSSDEVQIALGKHSYSTSYSHTSYNIVVRIRDQQGNEIELEKRISIPEGLGINIPNNTNFIGSISPFKQAFKQLNLNDLTTALILSIVGSTINPY